MDKVPLSSLTDREIVQTVVHEMRRRNLLGCVFMFPESGGNGLFASSTPANTMSGFSAATQLEIFAELAAEGTEQTRQIMVETPTSKMVN